MALGKRPPPLPKCSSSDIPKIWIEVQASTVPRKRGRGPSRGLTVEKLYKKFGHKIPVEFNTTSRRPKGKYNGEFIGYIGIIVRTSLPHQVRYFRKFKAKDFHEAFAFIQNYFVVDILLDNLCQEVVLRTMSNIFWAYRGELSAWFKQHGGDPEVRLTPFPNVNESDWKWLCDNIFATKSFQGIDNSPINQFKQTHFSRKGAWGSRVEEKYGKDVLGSRSGYIKGQGQVQPAVPKRPRGASSSSSSIQNMIDQVREEHRREIEKLEENSCQLEEMHREIIQMMQELRDS
ncbi:hypothetical protein H6P81_006310 [Aristolochia fimbriata]|uniref:Transposase n=1 Tax=Aristolochia fimbriata TaxID=158543 RepID=A0AAV7F0N3_ARIFI|nr:hypothetical protein H6P81_006310 [Aristolochia fimbriata]